MFQVKGSTGPKTGHERGTVSLMSSIYATPVALEVLPDGRKPGAAVFIVTVKLPGGLVDLTF